MPLEKFVFTVNRPMNLLIMKVSLISLSSELPVAYGSCVQLNLELKKKLWFCNLISLQTFLLTYPIMHAPVHLVYRSPTAVNPFSYISNILLHSGISCVYYRPTHNIWSVSLLLKSPSLTSNNTLLGLKLPNGVPAAHCYWCHSELLNYWSTPSSY